LRRVAASFILAMVAVPARLASWVRQGSFDSAGTFAQDDTELRGFLGFRLGI